MGNRIFIFTTFLVFVLAIFEVISAVPLTFEKTTSLRRSGVECPCLSPQWCNLIPDSNKREIFAFSAKNDSSHWHKYDWTKLTTVVMVGYHSDDLMCLAHALNTKVSYLANINFDFRDSTLRQRWIQQQVDFMQRHFLDGINFDYEDIIKKSDTETRNSYTNLVAETNAVLKKVFNHSQVTVDVAWEPDSDQRYYDYKGLADSCDFLFVMAYNEQSQIHGKCVAMPNSGFMKTLIGLGIYVTKGIPKDQLVLGLPWYGFIYPCEKMDGDSCYIKPVPFRGAPCSDAAGKGTDYTHIRLMSQQHTVKWNQTAFTPYFNYVNTTDNKNYQVQYDNPKSLRKKYNLVFKMNLRGVGMWNIDSVDYRDTSDGRSCRSEMFGALPEF